MKNHQINQYMARINFQSCPFKKITPKFSTWTTNQRILWTRNNRWSLTNNFQRNKFFSLSQKKFLKNNNFPKLWKNWRMKRERKTETFPSSSAGQPWTGTQNTKRCWRERASFGSKSMNRWKSRKGSTKETRMLITLLKTWTECFPLVLVLRIRRKGAYGWGKSSIEF